MSVDTADYRKPNTWLVLAVFLVLVLGIGLFIGTQTRPDEWFEQLVKPPLNPPNSVFGPVWTTIYVMIAIAGWRIWMDNPNAPAMKFWFAQMLFNFAWSPIWFGAEMPWLAFVVIVAMWVSVAGFIATARHQDKLAAWLFVPYLAWVSFATYLNLSIALLNPGA